MFRINPPALAGLSFPSAILWKCLGLVLQTPFLQSLESCSGLYRMCGWRQDGGVGEGLNEPGRRDQLPISLPLDGGGREAFSTAGQPDPLARTGIHHPWLSPIQTQPRK